MLLGGPDYRIKVGGQVFRFEMHPYCGPMPINRDSSEKVLPPKHEFWRVVTLWHKQGRKIDGGLCEWAEPIDPPMPTAILPRPKLKLMK